MSKDLSKLKEQYEALGREIKALETFVPGWYLCWNGRIDTAPYSKKVVYLEKSDDNRCEDFENVERLTPELLAPLFDKPKTRYNWPGIIKQYPEAQWVSTDEDGRVDLWLNKPKVFESEWIRADGGPLVKDGYCKYINRKGWRDSLEKRPDYL